MQNYEIKLHDIKPLVEIQDYSLYYFIALVVGTLILVSLFVYFFMRWYKNRHRFNPREDNFKLLSAVDIKDAKDAAYEITLYGLIFKDDSDEHRAAYENLQNALQNYKYKKYVDNFDKETKECFDTYLGMINV